MPFDKVEGFRPFTWEDKDLEAWNDASACMGKYKSAMIDPSMLNALICEVQAWRRENSGKEFVSGPNEIKEKNENTGKTEPSMVGESTKNETG